MNTEFDSYDPAAGKLPTQAEWDEILAICAKQHAQYWNDPAIQTPPVRVITSALSCIVLL